MIKQERIINHIKKIFNKKFLPFLYFFFFACVVIIVIFAGKTRTFTDNKNFKSNLIKNINIQKNVNIEPLSIESTRLFYFIVQVLAGSGYTRCDQYLPEEECSVNSDTTRGIYELRIPVSKTAAGFKKNELIPPYHTLKTLMVNTGIESAKNIGIILYTGKDTITRIMKILTLINSGSTHIDECNRPLYSKWYFIEDEYSYEVLKGKYNISNRDIVNRQDNAVNIFNMDSLGHWKSSSVQRDKILNYLNTDMNMSEPDFKMLKSLWCE